MRNDYSTPSYVHNGYETTYSSLLFTIYVDCLFALIIICRTYTRHMSNTLNFAAKPTVSFMYVVETALVLKAATARKLKEAFFDTNR